jgi:hypothetical protein
MLRRGRLWTVGWLLLAALIQVSAPARAAAMTARDFDCLQMTASAPGPGGHAAHMAAMAAAGVDVSGMDMGQTPMSHADMSQTGMAETDMSGMAGMHHAAPGSGDDGKTPPPCNYDCCSGCRIAVAVVLPLMWSMAVPSGETADVAVSRSAPDQIPERRVSLRPAIRAPPQAA